ncbi:MAG: hypothetical protein AAF318_14665 [Pseudomonadota bacterium]
MIMAMTYLIVGVAAPAMAIAILALKRSVEETLAVGFFALSGVGILAALATDGVYIDASYGLNDIYMFLDQAARSADGLVPSVDYMSPIGPAYAAILAAALEFGPPTVARLVTANLLVAVGAGALTLVFLVGRASLLTVAASVLIVTATALSLREITLPFAWSAASAITPYNRYGWALLLPIALFLTLPPLARPSPVELLRAGLVGVVAAGLLLLKASYGAVAVALIVGCAVVRPRSLIVGAVALGSLGLSLVAVQVFVVPLGPHLADLMAIAEASTGPRRFLKVLRMAGEAGVYFALAATFLVLLSTDRRPVAALLQRWRLMLLLAGLVVAGLLGLFQNHYSSEAVTYFIMLLLVVEWTRGAASVQRPVLVAVAALIAVRVAVVDVGAVAAQAVGTRLYPPVPLAGTPFAGLVVDPRAFPDRRLPPDLTRCKEGNCHQIAKIVEGRALLGDAVGPDDGVLALTFSNPFAAEFGRPLRGAPIWFHEGRSFSRAAPPDPDVVFQDATFVILEKGEPSAIVLEEVYGPRLAERYAPVSEGRYWTLYRRLGPAPPG